jgi:hypothetical protein
MRILTAAFFLFIGLMSLCAQVNDSSAVKTDSLEIVHYQALIQQLEEQKKKQTELQPYIKIESQIDLLYYLIEEKQLKIKNKIKK